jgi:hypothetical protein
LDPDVTTKQWFEEDTDDELIMHLQLDKDAPHKLNHHLIEMGYESFNPIFNIGGLFFTIVYFIVLIGFALNLKVIMILLDKARPQYR